MKRDLSGESLYPSKHSYALSAASCLWAYTATKDAPPPTLSKINLSPFYAPILEKQATLISIRTMHCILVRL